MAGKPLVVVALGLCLIVGSARAQDDKEKAQAAFEAGKVKYEAGEYAAAAAAFREAYEIKPNWKLLYNIGQCEALAKRPGLALQAFESYLTEGGDDISGERREEVLAEVERLRKMVGALKVKAPDGAVVIVDGVERDRTPLPGPIMIGAGITHQVKVVLGDDVLVDRPVRVSGGQAVTVEAEKEAEVAPAPEAGVGTNEGEEVQPPEPLETDDEAQPLAVAGWIAVGVGGAAMIAGAITGGLALSKDKQLEDDCPDGECSPEHWKENDKMKDLAITTDVLIPVGAAIAATGVVLLIVSAGDGEQVDDADVALAPIVGAGVGGLSLQGRF